MRRESCPRRSERVLAQGTSDTLVLLNLDDGAYFALNEVGNRVWELCNGARSVSEIISITCREYDAPPEVVETDVLELFGELAEEGLVVEEE